MRRGTRSIAVVGLGKLGCPMAAVFADKGFETIGVDINPDTVDALNAGRALVQEPHLQETIDRARAKLRATTDVARAISNTDVSFVIVPTPSTADNTFSNVHLERALDGIGDALKQTKRPHCVVVASTVMPGSTSVLAARLERRSGRKLGAELGVCYSPEFIALGSVIENLRRPDIVLIGESDEKAGDVISEIYTRTHDNSPEVHRMNFVNAEVCKLALNAYVTTKITYANMIADLCERLPGGDCDVVTRALGGDSRVGRRYFRGAMGYGGPCFPRDNKALSAFARQLGANSGLAEATDALNDYQVPRLVELVRARVAPGAKVAVLGVAYKPDTNVVDASQGILLAQQLHRQGYQVAVADPQAAEAAAPILGAGIPCSFSMEEALRDAAAAVIATPWPEFAAIGRTARAKPLLVFDPWQAINAGELDANVALVVPGRHYAAPPT
jgi:UDPglucose 6-dehydrogenase